MSAENTADTSASREPERIEKPTTGILHEVIEERIKVNFGPLKEQISTLTQPTADSVDARKFGMYFSNAIHSYSADTGETFSPSHEAEPLEPCQQGKSRVPDCQPTLFLVGAYISMHGEQLDTIDSIINKRRCEWQ